jgi:hypothetical protein
MCNINLRKIFGDPMNDHSVALIRSFYGWFREKDPVKILFQSRRFTWKGSATLKEKIHQKNP